MSNTILKWAGGKAKVLQEIEKRLDKIETKDSTFFDLFCGAGSVSFRFQDRFKKVIMNDINEDLINVFNCVKNDFKHIITLLQEHEKSHSHDYYYEVRGWDRLENYSILAAEDKAARMIYLNKTCYNGLYRVNSSGYFNVPLGRQSTLKLFDQNIMASVSNKLSKIEILNKDYTVVLDKCKRGDVVYLDPPYDLINSSSFVGYNSKVFDKFDQERLLLDINKLTRRGVYVIASNALTDRIKALYNDYIKEDSIIYVGRSIGSNGKSRYKVPEILIDNIDEVNNVNTSKSREE